MAGLLVAVEAAGALTSTALQMLQGAQQIHDMIAQARAEGRDISDDEMQVVIAARKRAEQALQASLAQPDPQAPRSA
jgi:hypothetical protein